MAQTYPAISDDLSEWIGAQPLFLVATAPLDGGGHINLSPKGLDSLRILGPNSAAYLDLTGSGNETSAHLLENGRITLMFCAFAGPPRIVRLYGKGKTVLPDSGEWNALRSLFPDHPGVRQIIVVDITRVQTSCGFGVPLMEYIGQRETLTRWAEAKGEETLVGYRAEKNRVSIDGLPAALGVEQSSGVENEGR
jgi:hypothetical protein